MDHLEKFIVENQEKFNDNIPSPEVWEHIEKELKEVKSNKFSIRKLMVAVSAAIGLIMMGVFFGINYGSDGLDHAISNSSFTDYKETEQYYALQVKNYIGQIKDNDTKSNIEEELEQLDEVYQELRDELINAEIKNQDIIINAMIENYQVKIGMLKRILDKTTEKEFIKDLNDTTNETISI